MATFRISIGLTEKGQANVNEIIRIVFAFINKLKERGPHKYIFDEQSTVYKMHFENGIISDILSLAQNKAEQLSNWNDDGTHCEARELFYRHFDWQDWRPDLVCQYLDLLSPQSAIFNFTTKAHEAK